MNNERFLYLLEKYYKDIILDDEIEELSLLIDKSNQLELINLISDKINSDEELESATTFDEIQIKKKINQILDIDRDNKYSTNIKKLNLLKLIASAAAIILLAGTAWLFYQNSSYYPKNNFTTKNSSIDIQPGKEGAILLLSDGTEVLLDSIGNSEIIADKEGFKVKIKNGQITYLDNKNLNTQSINSIHTPPGRKFQLTLSDDTKVWLNSGSSIEYPVVFSGKNRQVIISGEAYFEVAKNQKKPFIVKIENSNTSIRVLGTHFNINSYADNELYKTTLLEGSIELNSGKSHSILAPNQQAISSVKTNEIQISKVDTEDIIAWKNDIFYFKEASIDEVMQDFKRWYNISVSYKGSKPNGTFTGKIQKSLTLNQALKILGTTRVEYKLLENNQLIIQ